MIRLLAHNTPNEDGLGHVLGAAAAFGTSPSRAWVDPFERAACRSHSVDMLVDLPWEQQRRQKAVCAVCPTSATCLNDLLANHVNPEDFSGVRAGMNRREYRHLLESLEFLIDLTVVTATIPERLFMLHELRQSIATQTRRPRWLVHTDHDRIGPSRIVNRLVDEVDTTWMFRCDDDDLFDADHFETIDAHLGDDVDIVWSWPRVDPPGWIGETGLQVDFPIEMLERFNWIPSAAAVRVDLWRDLGGYRHVHNEDHDLWLRAHRAGARFRLVPQVTWTYRLGDWPHLSEPR